MVTFGKRLMGVLVLALVAAVPLGCGSSNERPREERSEGGVRVGGDYGVVVDHGVSVGGEHGVVVDHGVSVGGDKGVVVDHGVTVGGDHGVVVDHPREGDR
jgi:hypothetical protein